MIDACKYVHIGYRKLINKVYILNYVSYAYNRSFGRMKHPSYWPKYKGPTMCNNLNMQRDKKGRQIQLVFAPRWTKEIPRNQGILSNV